MQEFEIYLPTTTNDHAPIDSRIIDGIKTKLAEVFGGYTHLQSRSEGAWRMGSVLFRDEVTLVRVLDDGSANFDWEGFKKELEKSLQQEAVLIICRDVQQI